jgi:Protein of unknown function (DUF2865)
MAALFALAAHGAKHLAAIALDLAPRGGTPVQAKQALAATLPAAAVHGAAVRPPQARLEGAVTLTQGWWDRPRRAESRWRDQERSRDLGWWRSGDEDDEDQPPLSQSRGTYRTVCVRLCDGFYWPISYATTPEHFGQDQRKCESSCGSPVRLYTYRNPGGEIEQMEDLSGRPYNRLKTAFLYRTEYNESCKCKSDPWEQASLDRHRMYALEASRRKGDKVAAQELQALKARVEESRKTTTAAQTTASTNKIAAAPDEIADKPAAEQSIDRASRDRRPARPDDSERISLGSRSASPSVSGAPPHRYWRDKADNAP